MQIYLVGGAVRDKLLGLPITERDWVVVGAKASQMLALGYRRVGKEFPVFLHPVTNEEYALARKERKTGPGYQGFDFDTSADVTLADDLVRRDLTINAMAETKEGQLIDPYHGKEDLEARILRHVSPAFAEDPVRILRVGRFLARYAHLGFKIAPETLALMRGIVASGEVNALVAERVWKELERALKEKSPQEFFHVLTQVNALPLLFPHLHWQGKGIKALQSASMLSNHAEVRFAALLHYMPETTLSKTKEEVKRTIASLCERYRVPNAYRELALLTALHFQEALESKAFNAEQLFHFFSKVDAFRRERRFLHFLTVCEALQSLQNKPTYFDTASLAGCLLAAKSIDVKSLLQAGFHGNALIKQIKNLRIEKMKTFLANEAGLKS